LAISASRPGNPQVTVKALLGGGAEFTLQRAAYLGGDAQGGASKLKEVAEIRAPEVVEEQRSTDGTIKWAIAVGDQGYG
jgi:hypothetical protein